MGRMSAWTRKGLLHPWPKHSTTRLARRVENVQVATVLIPMMLYWTVDIGASAQTGARRAPFGISRFMA